MRRGYIQVYTGAGKGKTTAALGLALRASGAGMRVYVAQFIKKRRCSEHRVISQRLSDLITVRLFGRGLILKRAVTKADVDASRKGLAEIRSILESGEYDMVILDEVNVAVRHKLVELDDLLGIMEEKPKPIELVLTGRYAHEAVIEKADLVTEMREVRHYKERGVGARRGIEC